MRTYASILCRISAKRPFGIWRANAHSYIFLFLFGECFSEKKNENHHQPTRIVALQNTHVHRVLNVIYCLLIHFFLARYARSFFPVPLLVFDNSQDMVDWYRKHQQKNVSTMFGPKRAKKSTDKILLEINWNKRLSVSSAVNDERGKLCFLEFQLLDISRKQKSQFYSRPTSTNFFMKNSNEEEIFLCNECLPNKRICFPPTVTKFGFIEFTYHQLNHYRPEICRFSAIATPFCAYFLFRHAKLKKIIFFLSLCLSSCIFLKYMCT